MICPKDGTNCPLYMTSISITVTFANQDPEMPTGSATPPTQYSNPHTNPNHQSPHHHPPNPLPPPLPPLPLRTHPTHPPNRIIDDLDRTLFLPNKRQVRFQTRRRRLVLFQRMVSQCCEAGFETGTAAATEGLCCARAFGGGLGGEVEGDGGGAGAGECRGGFGGRLPA